MQQKQEPALLRPTKASGSITGCSASDRLTYLNALCFFLQKVIFKVSFGTSSFCLPH